ncbi:MAG: hypothetical protein WKG32_08340 [Gemmatimonadaceae bacterium]
MSRARTDAPEHVRPLGAGGEPAAPPAERAAPTIGDVWAVRGAHYSMFHNVAGMLEVQVDFERQVDGNDLLIDVTTGGVREDGQSWHGKTDLTIPAPCIEAFIAALAGAYAEGQRTGMFPQAAGAVS